MSEIQSNKAGEFNASTQASIMDSRPKIGNIYRVADASAINAQIKGDAMEGQIEDGAFVLSIGTRGDHGSATIKTVYAVLDVEEHADYKGFSIRLYSVFSLVGSPGPVEQELTAHDFVHLNSDDGFYFTGGENDLHGDLPGAVLRIDNAAEANESVVGAMRGKLKNGDVVLNVRERDGSQIEYALLRRFALGWQEVADSRFMAADHIGSYLTSVSADEYAALTQGAMARHKDYGREMDYAREPERAVGSGVVSKIIQ